MLTAAWVCVIVRYVTGDIRWDARGRLFELVGVALLPLTLITAIIDTRGFGFLIHPRPDAPLIWHMTAGLIASGAFAGHYVWRRRREVSDLTGWRAVQDVALITFAMVALLATGLIAGEMVYGA